MNLFTAVLLGIITSARLEQCTDMGWKSNNVKALHDCDLLKQKSTICLNDLVAKPQCVNHIRVTFVDSDGQTHRAGPINNPGREVQIGTRVPNKCLSHDVTVFVMCKCTGSRFFVSKFKLDPLKCSDMRTELNFTINGKDNTAVIDNGYFYKSNKYISYCMRNVTLISSNGTEINNKWKNEYEVPVDQCKNETFTLIYTLASSKKSEGKVVKKVVKIPRNPNCLDNGEENQVALGSTITGGSVMFILLLTTGILCYKKSRKANDATNENMDTDENHVYGTYSRGWEENGVYGDGDTVEVTDNNPMYET